MQVWFVERGRLVKRVVTFDMLEEGRGDGDEVRSLDSASGRRAETRWVYELEGR